MTAPTQQHVRESSYLTVVWSLVGACVLLNRGRSRKVDDYGQQDEGSIF